ncbi:hypothetical protein [Deinococcus sp.]|uniref:hypothetical protein n=1 Tax=Deinococcus sp. TaxID=47478 RepID=UPI0025F78F9C|nr:hypothetical protein [Deinococcus sp.]
MTYIYNFLNSKLATSETMVVYGKRLHILENRLDARLLSSDFVTSNQKITYIRGFKSTVYVNNDHDAPSERLKGTGTGQIHRKHEWEEHIASGVTAFRFDEYK